MLVENKEMRTAGIQKYFGVWYHDGEIGKGKLASTDSHGCLHDTYVKELQTLLLWTRIASRPLTGRLRERGTGGYYSVILEKKQRVCN